MVGQNLLRTYEVDRSFREKNIEFDDSVDLPNFHMCPTSSELPSNISTMQIATPRPNGRTQGESKGGVNMHRLLTHSFSLLKSQDI